MTDRNKGLALAAWSVLIGLLAEKASEDDDSADRIIDLVDRSLLQMEGWPDHPGLADARWHVEALLELLRATRERGRGDQSNRAPI